MHYCKTGMSFSVILPRVAVSLSEDKTSSSANLQNSSGFSVFRHPFLSISRNLNIVAHYSGFVNTSGPFSEIKIVFS